MPSAPRADASCSSPAFRKQGPAEHLAEANGIARGYLSSRLRPTLLAPDIVEAVLAGRQLVVLGQPQLLESFPADWAAPRDVIDSGFKI